MATYNGHKNWNHWNVSLWLNNDVVLYRLAKGFVDEGIGKDAAAKHLYEFLVALESPKTPDGAPYSVTTIRAAMVGM